MVTIKSSMLPANGCSFSLHVNMCFIYCSLWFSLCRIIQNRILIFILGAVVLLTIILAVYLNLRGH